jgi:hypothetical protein
MSGFKQWLMQQESTARKRAAMNPGMPAQASGWNAKPPYSAFAFCNKIKLPGVRTDNMNTQDVCGKDKVKSKPTYPNV